MVFGVISDIGGALLDGAEAVTKPSSWLDTLSDAGSLLELGGDIYNVLGTSSADRKRAQTPQFSRIPIQDVLSDFDAYRQYLSKNLRPVVRPTRRMTSSEVNDPVFGMRGVSELQSYADAIKALQEAGSPGKQQAAGSMPVVNDVRIDNIENRQLQETGNPQFQQMVNEMIESGFIPRAGMNINTSPEAIKASRPNGLNIGGQEYSGDALVRRLAEDAAIRKMAGDMGISRSGVPINQGDITSRRAATQNMSVAPLSRGDTYTNRFIPQNEGNVYNRSDYINALMSGDVGATRKMVNIAAYDPRPGFLGKISPLIKMGALAAFTGGAASGLAPALGITSSLGTKALGTGLNEALNRSMA